MSIAVVILAAGKGTRMVSDLPKALHKVAHAPLLTHAMRASACLEPEKTVIVVGHEAEQVAAAAREIDETALIAEQKDQLGTGHAVSMAKEALSGFDGDILVLYADTPFISEETMQAIKSARNTSDLVVLGFKAKDPARYGRLITNGDSLERIVEFKDANDEERAITLCNSGVMAGPAPLLFSLLEEIDNKNATGEFYLTDCVAHARSAGKTTRVVICDEKETLGVNSRLDLANAEAAFQDRARKEHMENGVSLLAPETVYFSFDTVIGRDSVVEQHVVFGPEATIETGAHIKSFCHIEGAHVSEGAVIGPFARLRPGAELGEQARVGNFVEIKNAVIGDGAKINHLSYVGDAEVGAGANIGAGSVTCNYDGVMKHKTTIGEGAFIGSNTMMVAPVTIGKDAMTGSGSVITKDVPDGALALARAEQNNKPGLARKLMDILKKRKQKRDLG